MVQFICRLDEVRGLGRRLSSDADLVRFVFVL